jgi:AcrR family transcriptional regulator
MAAHSQSESQADRPQQRRQQTSRDLLDAARGVLAEKGYHGAKVVDIARAARVGVGTFYLYYPTKEAIFIELVEDTIRKLKQELDALHASTNDPRLASRKSVEALFRFAQENRELFRIVFGHGATFHDVVRRAQEMFVADAVAHLEAGMRAGVFRKSRPDILAHAFIGMSLQVISWWIEQEDVPVEEVTETLIDLAFRGLECEASDRSRDQ